MAMGLVRKSSSLILISKCTAAFSPTYTHWKEVGPEDYAVTLLKRSSKSKFMPDALVFPGGVHDVADADPAWLELFSKCEVSSQKINQLFRQPDALRAGTYRSLAKQMEMLPNQTEDAMMLPEFSLRLTALRETFEETGLLLARPVVAGVPSDPIALTEHGAYPISMNSTLSNEELMKTHTRYGAVMGENLKGWRAAVNAEPAKFAEMFASTRGMKGALLPWVEGLVEWWAWLTPITYLTARYDTMFYTALLPHLELLPHMMSACSESSQLLVVRPSAAVQDHQCGSSWLAPPQLYEFGRLARFRSLAEVAAHVASRTGAGARVAAAVHTWTPQVYKSLDSFITTLPGDELYDRNYTLDADGSAPLLHCSSADLRSACADDLPKLTRSPADAQAALRDAQRRPSVPLNRVESNKRLHCSFVTNTNTDHGQVTPVDICGSLS
ncbi:acyl-coenzyme A diphosphatase NUDT19 [Hyalella azteca]|uniref:Acyl-coenzyme A diphosphatase NUDT19 n=1 Tax=Hyalella azteca TaxID=294128 RepID=A0A8B7NX05_HYAAZ|nr:acyl-coenzyme A diphosphatase NUDT19 [Hyalella azteca]